MFWFDLSTLNYLLSLGGIAVTIVTVVLFVDYFFNRSTLYVRFVKAFAWPVIIATTVGGVVIALVYSEYYGFVPCSLCWLQRIALFPLALFAIMALKMNDTKQFPLYGIGLSLFGLAVSVYHYIYQMIPEDTSSGSVMPCLADGTGDCAVKVINEFGFVTFPFLSAVLFAFLIALFLHLRRQK
ncbi:MAG TPA: disulfide bond formation protein B [Candidatus Paceibacterota bacterium]